MSTPHPILPQCECALDDCFDELPVTWFRFNELKGAGVGRKVVLPDHQDSNDTIVKNYEAYLVVRSKDTVD